MGMRSLPCSLLLLLLAAAVQPSDSVEVGMMYEGWQAPAYWGRSRKNLTCAPTCVYCIALTHEFSH
jgi:hypothetical protein|eukprot:COSAG06_NODE_11050_length_1576_cov_1.119160_3_plen_66_part_00